MKLSSTKHVTRTGVVKRNPNKKINVYSVDAWIHPASGGDDKEVIFEVEASSLKEAKLKVVNQLKKRHSVILDDYEIWKDYEIVG